MRGDTGDFFQCHQCFHLSERPAREQQEDCSTVIARLLEEDASSLDVRLSTEIRPGGGRGGARFFFHMFP